MLRYRDTASFATFGADNERADDLIAGANNGEADLEILQIETTPLLQAANMMGSVP